MPDTPSEIPSKSSPIIVEKTHTTGWRFSPLHSTNSYRSTTKTIIAQLDSFRIHSDSSQTTTDFTLDVNYLATSTNTAGKVTYIPSNTASILHLPLLFAATISSGQFNLGPVSPQPNNEQCNTAISQTLGEIRTAIYSLPLQLNPDSKWSDSTSTSTCSGKGLPTRLKIVRLYNVVGESDYNGEPVLLLNRQDQIQLTGEGAQEQHQLQLQGNGTAVSRIAIKVKTGILVAINTAQELQITVRTSGQLRKFTQTTHQQISLVR